MDRMTRRAVRHTRATFDYILPLGRVAVSLGSRRRVMSNKSVPISVDGAGRQASGGFRSAERSRVTVSPGSDIDA